MDLIELQSSEEFMKHTIATGNTICGTYSILLLLGCIELAQKKSADNSETVKPP